MGSNDIRTANFRVAQKMREQKLMVRLNKEEMARLGRVAESHGLQTASWARAELLKAAKKQEGEAAGSQPAKRSGQYELLSLFCGPGGLDEGFRKAGFQTALAFDIHSDSITTFQKNHLEATAKVQDIRELTLEKLDELYGGEFRPYGVLGGPPCQSFSQSNVHQTDDDPRHQLPEAYARILRQLNARHPISFFIFENVPGLLGKRHAHRYEKFKSMFREAGFEIFEELVDAQDYGVPQVRPRVIIVGINFKLHPKAKWHVPPVEKDVKTVKDAISGLPEPVYNDRGLDPDTFPVHPNHWCLVPRSQKFANARLEEGQMFGRSFRTLAWNEPSWTVAYGHREVHVHPSGKRRLSIYEAMLLQSFPKTYRLYGNLSSQIKQVSEAVPPRLAWHLACAIKKALGIKNG